MSVRIRLQRHGAKKRPFYRVVATDQRNARDGKFIELLGTYDPMVEPPAVRLNGDRINYWIGVGAQPSDTVAVLIRKMDEPHVIDLSKTGAEETARKEKREAKKQDIEARRAEATAAAKKADETPAKVAEPVAEVVEESAAPEAEGGEEA